MRDINDLIKATALKLNMDEDVVSVILRYHWRDIRVRINNKDSIFINVGGFGVIRFNAVYTLKYLQRKNGVIKKYADEIIEKPESKYQGFFHRQIEVAKSEIRLVLDLYERFKKRVENKDNYERTLFGCQANYLRFPELFELEKYQSGEQTSDYQEKKDM